MNNKIIKICAMIVFLAMFGLLSSQNASAYTSSVNPVDSTNVPASELNRQIVFTDQNLHRQLNNIFRGAESLQSFTIGEAQTAIGGGWQFELTDVSNLEGLQYFKGYWNYDSWVIDGSVGDFSPIPDLPSGYQVSRWHSMRISTTASKIENLAGIKNGYGYVNIQNEQYQTGDPKGVFSEESIVGLSKLDKIQGLQIQNIKIIDANPIGDLTDLGDLMIVNAEVDDVSSLSKLTKLYRLNLSYNNISDISFINNLNLSNFRDRGLLNLSNNQISDISSIINKPVNKRITFSLVNNNISTLSQMVDDQNKFLVLFGNKISNATLFRFAGSTDAIDIDSPNYDDTGVDLYNLISDYDLRTAVYYRGGQRPETTVRQKTFKNPLTDRDGNPIPIIETEFVKNGSNGEIVLLVDDERGSVRVSWDATTVPYGFYGELTINYDFTLNNANSGNSVSIKAPNTGVKGENLAVAGCIVLLFVRIMIWKKENLVRF